MLGISASRSRERTGVDGETVSQAGEAVHRLSIVVARRGSESLIALHAPELSVETELLGGDESLDGTCPSLDLFVAPGESGGVD